MRIGALLVVAASAATGTLSAQSPNDTLAVLRGAATAVASKPGGPLLVGGDGELTEVLATSLKARRARAGELPNCGGLVGRLGVAPMTQAGGYVVVIKAPEFSSDRAVVSVTLRCMNTMGGRRGGIARNEVLVFRKESNDWVLAERSSK
jgi:hypothetical protein